MIWRTRRHAAALVSDPSLVVEPHDRYKDLTSPGSQLLLGPRYAALRSEFADAPPRLPAPGGEAMRFLIAFGGVDAAGMTRVAIEALAAVVEAGDHAHVVVGAAHEGRAAIAGRCAELGWTCHVNSSRMGQLWRLQIWPLVLAAAWSGNAWRWACLPSLLSSRIISGISERGGPA